jgi:hypothetical protein
VSRKNPHEPNTLQAYAWAMLKPVRQAEAKRRKKTKGAFGKSKKGGQP